MVTSSRALLPRAICLRKVGRAQSGSDVGKKVQHFKRIKRDGMWATCQGFTEEQASKQTEKIGDGQTDQDEREDTKNCPQCETAQIDFSSRRAPSSRARLVSNSRRFATISSDGCNNASQSAIAVGPEIGSFAVNARGSASCSASTSDWSRIIGTLSVYRCMATVRRYSLSRVQSRSSVTYNRNSSAPRP
jgi:hypothetical protein